MPCGTSIDPHRFIERQLMDSGGKRMAYFAFNDLPRALVFEPGAEDLRSKFIRAYAMFERRLISARVLHARCGLLLGYKKDDVRAFLRRGERVK